MTELKAQKLATHSKKGIFRDPDIETEHTIDNDDFSAAKDRTYDIRGLDTMYIRLEDTGDETFDFWVGKTTKPFDDLSELATTDFVAVSTDTVVSHDFVELATMDVAGPRYTAVLLRTKHTVTTDTTARISVRSY